MLFCSASQWLVYLLLLFSGLDLIGKCIGEEAKYEGIRLLFDGMQQPVLNKQVTCNTWETSFWERISWSECMAVAEEWPLIQSENKKQ